MATRFVDFERTKLFEQVWAKPMTQVAEVYGVSAADVKRAAQQLAVPLPPQGHWTKVSHGKGTTRPGLPAFDGKTTFRHTWWVNDETEEVDRRFASIQNQLPAAPSALPELKSQVSDCLPIIKRMAASLKKTYKDTRNWPAVSMWGQFEVSVAPANQERALLTLDRALRLCQSAGFKLVTDESKRESAHLLVNGVAFTMRIFESGRREERELTAKEKAEIRANPNAYHYIPDRYIFHPTNVLKLEVHEPEYRTTQLTLQDGAQEALADRLLSLPQRLMECATKRKLREDIRAEEQRRTEERREAHQRKLETKRRELEKLKHYEDLANQLERASRLRRLAEVLQGSGVLAGDQAEAKLAWIRNAADWLDPAVDKHWPEVDDVRDGYY